MREGYWKFYRSMWDWPWSNRPAYFSVWCWLLSEAQYQDGKSIIFHGKRISIKSGQLTCGAYQISSATGVPRGTVERILKIFKSEEQINVKTDMQKSLITIINWKHYQTSEERVRNDRGTSEERVRNTEEGKKERRKELNIDKQKNVDKSVESVDKYTPVSKFEPKNNEESIAKEIAIDLGEEYINFILSAIKKRGINAVKRAYGYVKEHQSPKDRKKLFNNYVKSLK